MSGHSSRQWRFINSGYCSGAVNMQMDEALAHQLVEQRGTPVLRVYGWNPAAVSLGYNQRRHDFDETLCAQQGIDIVRRPTGGRAILHSDEATYCVVMESGGKNVMEMYAAISQALVCGLRMLGAGVSFAETEPDFPRLYRSDVSIPCFASSSKFEIQWNGKKLIGSAQRRYRRCDNSEVVLQHGSLLLGPGHRQLHQFIAIRDEKVRAAIIQDIETKTIELSAVMSRRVDFPEAADFLKKGFEKEWGILFTEEKKTALQI